MPDYHNLLDLGSSIYDRFQDEATKRTEKALLDQEDPDERKEWEQWAQGSIKQAANVLGPRGGHHPFHRVGIGASVTQRIAHPMEAPQTTADLTPEEVARVRMVKASALYSRHPWQGHEYLNRWLPETEIIPENSDDLGITVRNKNTGKVTYAIRGTEVEGSMTTDSTDPMKRGQWGRSNRTAPMMEDMFTNVSGILPPGMSKYTPQLKRTRAMAERNHARFGRNFTDVVGHSKGGFHVDDIAKLKHMKLNTMKINPASMWEAMTYRPQKGLTHTILTNPGDMASLPARLDAEGQKRKGFNIKSIRPMGYSPAGLGMEHELDNYLPENEPANRFTRDYNEFKYHSDKGTEAYFRILARKHLLNGNTFAQAMHEFNSYGGEDTHMVPEENPTVPGQKRVALREMGGEIDPEIGRRTGGGRMTQRRTAQYEAWIDMAERMGVDPFTAEEETLFRDADARLTEQGVPTRLGPKTTNEIGGMMMEHEIDAVKRANPDQLKLLEDHYQGLRTEAQETFDATQEAEMQQMNPEEQTVVREGVKSLTRLVRTGALTGINLGTGLGAGLAAHKMMEQIDKDHHLEPHARVALEGALMGPQAEIYAGRIAMRAAPNILRLGSASLVGASAYLMATGVAEGSSKIYEALGASHQGAAVGGTLTGGGAAGAFATARGVHTAANVTTNAAMRLGAMAARPVTTSVAGQAARAAAQRVGTSVATQVGENVGVQMLRQVGTRIASTAVGTAAMSALEAMGAGATAGAIGGEGGGIVGALVGAGIGIAVGGIVALADAMKPHSQFGLTPHYLSGVPGWETDHIVGNDPEIRKLFRDFNAWPTDFSAHSKNELTTKVLARMHEMAASGIIPQDYVDQVADLGLELTEIGGRNWVNSDEDNAEDGNEDFMVYADWEDEQDRMLREDPEGVEAEFWRTSDVRAQLEDPNISPEYAAEMANPNPNARRHFWLLNQAIVKTIDRFTTGDLGFGSVAEEDKWQYQNYENDPGWQEHYMIGPWWHMKNEAMGIPQYDLNTGSLSHEGGVYRTMRYQPEVRQNEDMNWLMQNAANSGQISYGSEIVRLVEQDDFYQELTSEMVSPSQLAEQQLAINRRIREIIERDPNIDHDMRYNLLNGRAVIPQINLTTGQWDHGSTWQNALSNDELWSANLDAFDHTPSHPADQGPPHPNEAHMTPEQTQARDRRKYERGHDIWTGDTSHSHMNEDQEAYYFSKMDAQTVNDRQRQAYAASHGRDYQEPSVRPPHQAPRVPQRREPRPNMPGANSHGPTF